MKHVIKLLLLFVSLQAAGQKTKTAYTGTVQAGLLEGEIGSSFQLKTVNGIRSNTWSGGIGAGLDYYHTRSIPLFLELRKEVSRGSSTPFVYVDAGYHFLWEKPEQKEWGETDASGAIYFDAGLGYQFAVIENNRLVLSAGESSTKLSTEL